MVRNVAATPFHEAECVIGLRIDNYRVSGAHEKLEHGTILQDLASDR